MLKRGIRMKKNFNVLRFFENKRSLCTMPAVLEDGNT